SASASSARRREGDHAMTGATPQVQNKRKTKVGRVVSDKMDKTIVVSVERLARHPLYKRVIRLTTKFKAHDELNDAHTGDTVLIQPQSRLRVADNTGARSIQCIRVMGRSLKTTAGVGDVIIASVKQAIPNAAVKKGDVVRAVVVRTSKEYGRPDGSYIRFDEN